MSTDPDRPVTRAEIDALALRIDRVEGFAFRLAGLLSAAGGVLDAAKLVANETLHPTSEG